MTAPRCVSCGANHHSDCWVENNGCAILGCIASPDGVAVATRDTPATEWSGSQPNGITHAIALNAPPVRSLEPAAPVAETGGAGDADAHRAGWQEGYRAGWQDAYRSGWQDGHHFSAQPVISPNGPAVSQPSGPTEGHTVDNSS
jgi:hypothetical protein